MNSGDYFMMASFGFIWLHLASFGFMLLPIASNKLQDSDYIKPVLLVFLQDISR